MIEREVSRKQLVILIVLSDKEEFAWLLVDTETNTNQTDLTCLTDDCVSMDDLTFTATAFPDGLREGATYHVEIYGSTGSSKGLSSNYTHIERN